MPLQSPFILFSWMTSQFRFQKTVRVFSCLGQRMAVQTGQSTNMYGLNFVSFNFDEFSHLTITHLPIFFKGRKEHDYSLFFFYLNKLKIFKHPGKFANQYIPIYRSNQYIPINRIFFSDYLLILYRLSWSLIFDFKFELS